MTKPLEQSCPPSIDPYTLIPNLQRTTADHTRFEVVDLAHPFAVVVIDSYCPDRDLIVCVRAPDNYFPQGEQSFDPSMEMVARVAEFARAAVKAVVISQLSVVGWPQSQEAHGHLVIRVFIYPIVGDRRAHMSARKTITTSMQQELQADERRNPPNRQMLELITGALGRTIIFRARHERSGPIPTEAERDERLRTPSSGSARELVAEIDGLYEKATQEQWTAAQLSGVTSRDELLAYLARCVEAGAQPLPFFLVVAALSDGPADVCHTGNGPRSEANALLASALKNAWPRIRSALAAADSEMHKAEPVPTPPTEDERTELHVRCGRAANRIVLNRLEHTLTEFDLARGYLDLVAQALSPRRSAASSGETAETDDDETCSGGTCEHGFDPGGGEYLRECSKHGGETAAMAPKTHAEKWDYAAARKFIGERRVATKFGPDRAFIVECHHVEGTAVMTEGGVSLSFERVWTNGWEPGTQIWFGIESWTELPLAESAARSEGPTAQDERRG